MLKDARAGKRVKGYSIKKRGLEEDPSPLKIIGEVGGGYKLFFKFSGRWGLTLFFNGIALRFMVYDMPILSNPPLAVLHTTWNPQSAGFV